MDYLKRVLGIKAIYEDRPLEHIPNYIRARYTLQCVWLNEQRVVFLYPKTELEQVKVVKKHVERVMESTGYPTALVLKRITTRQKEYLLREKIAFIVDEKQIYLPFMAVYLQECCNAEKISRDEILPSAQVLLLHFIYKGANELTTSQAAKALGLTPTSISRASRQLEEMELLKTRKVGVQKILFSDAVPKELFYRAEKSLISPVKRTVYVPKEMVNIELQESSYSALSEYSMLNAPRVRYYASDKISQWSDCMTNSLLESSSQVAVEMWRYNPKKLSAYKAVDVLSLALSLRDDADERVGEAVEEMLKNLWRELDGNRNRKL